MPLMPPAEWLATRPVLEEGFYGTLRLERNGFRYWLDDGDRVWVEQETATGWRRVEGYDGTEVPT